MHYLLPEDVELLKKLAGMIPAGPSMVIDLGVGDGGTAVTILLANPNPNAFVFSVDIDSIAMTKVMTLIDSLGFLGRWHGDISRSDRALMPLLNYPISLLMCDATHDYASQQDELNHWIPRLQKGTLVWIHEYAGYAGISYPGVKIAVDEFIARELLETIEISGLGWAGRTV